MLRLTDIKLDLDHAEGAIKAAVLKRLDLKPQDLLGYSVYRRAVDARKRSAIALTYTLDVEVRNEAALLKRFARDRNVAVSPDEGYRLKAHIPEAATLAVTLTNRAGLAAPVQVIASADGGRMRLEVLDRGEAADSDDTLEEADSIDAGLEGGLSLSLSLIDGLVDELDIAPREGGGSTVTMTLIDQVEPRGREDPTAGVT